MLFFNSYTWRNWKQLYHFFVVYFHWNFNYNYLSSYRRKKRYMERDKLPARKSRIFWPIYSSSGKKYRTKYDRFIYCVRGGLMSAQLFMLGSDKKFGGGAIQLPQTRNWKGADRALGKLCVWNVATLDAAALTRKFLFAASLALRCIYLQSARRILNFNYLDDDWEPGQKQ